MAPGMIVRASLLAVGSLSRPVNYCSSVNVKRLFLSTRFGVTELIWINIALFIGVLLLHVSKITHIFFFF